MEPYYASAWRSPVDGAGCQMAVEAWLIAPFFWLLGSSVLAMKIPLVRLAWIWRRAARPASLGVFLGLVGCVAVVAYPPGCNLDVGAPSAAPLSPVVAERPQTR